MIQDRTSFLLTRINASAYSDFRSDVFFSQ
jgi:hypothetical protein